MGCSFRERLCSSVTIKSGQPHVELVKKLSRSTILVIAGCLTALILGLALAYPLLVLDLPVTRKVNLQVDLAYAYFGKPYLDPNVTGLWRNTTQSEAVQTNGGRFAFDVNVLSYLIVLNITNPSNEETMITNFDLTVAPQITLGASGSLSAINPLITDSRNILVYPGGVILGTNTSKLIVLSGVVGVHDVTYGSMNGSITCLYAKVDGQAWGGEKAQFVGQDFKQVKLESFGDAYLYNKLVGENQTLIFYHDLDVVVGTRQPA